MNAAEARETIRKTLEEHPTLALIIDDMTTSEHLAICGARHDTAIHQIVSRRTKETPSASALRFSKLSTAKMKTSKPNDAPSNRSPVSTRQRSKTSSRMPTTMATQN